MVVTFTHHNLAALFSQSHIGAFFCKPPLRCAYHRQPVAQSRFSINLSCNAGVFPQGQTRLKPPLTSSTVPVMYAVSSLAKKQMACARSCGVPKRPAGI